MPLINEPELIQRQSLPLEAKIQFSKQRIVEWDNHWDENIVVSYSGGKDSEVLLHIVRSIYPSVKAVFVHTGLEYPEIIDQVHTQSNVEIIKPKLTFQKVLEKYGYPIISKQVARYVSDCKKIGAKNEITRRLRLTGYNSKGIYCKNMILAKKWQFLIDSPFKISAICCDCIKKSPLTNYCKKHKVYPLTGEMTNDSFMRKLNYLKTGCNNFGGKHPKSTPLAIWTQQNILEYIQKFNLPISKIYGSIISNPVTNQLEFTGENHTGCTFCMFGIQYDKTPNRFQRMKITHPKMYNYCINTLGLKEVLEFINIPYE
jgi:3'-phosphoadenosine 5'-phosphosulfate sulfotransferase (PAPS reductase)/FAD synthetase